ncbi:MAG: hypothetical protein K0Q85_536, partial [Caproiciproducens sp.]|nr:hypothetical protein [Caproiciproducens sp.]
NKADHRQYHRRIPRLERGLHKQLETLRRHLCGGGTNSRQLYAGEILLGNKFADSGGMED